MCSSHALFLCARNTAQKERRRERERENTTIVQKEESSSHDNAVQERTTRTGRPRRERSSLTAHERKQLCTSIPIPNSQLIKRGEEKRFWCKTRIVVIKRVYLVFLLQTLVALVQTVEDLLKHLLLLVHFTERLVDLRLELTNRRHDDTN